MNEHDLKRQIEAEEEQIAIMSRCTNKECSYWSEWYQDCVLPDWCIYDCPDDLMDVE